jgi:hypothetical protein
MGTIQHVLQLTDIIQQLPSAAKQQPQLEQ